MQFRTRNGNLYHLSYSIWVTLGVFSLLALLTFLADNPTEHLSNNAILYGLFILNAFLLPLNLQRQRHYKPFPLKQDPLTFLRVERDQLMVGKQTVALNSVNKVVLDELDDKLAYLHLPFNAGGKIGFSFPLAHLPAVKAFLRDALPHAQIIR